MLFFFFFLVSRRIFHADATFRMEWFLLLYVEFDVSWNMRCNIYNSGILRTGIHLKCKWESRWLISWLVFNCILEIKRREIWLRREFGKCCLIILHLIIIYLKIYIDYNFSINFNFNFNCNFNLTGFLICTLRLIWQLCFMIWVYTLFLYNMPGLF